MAIIPIKRNTKIRRAALQSGGSPSAVSPDLLGGGTSRDQLKAVPAALSEVSDALAKIQQRDDADAILTADTLYKNVESAKILSLTQSRGNRARGLSDKARAWFDGNTNVIGAESTVEEVEYQNFYESMNDGQKAQFDRKRSQREVGFRSHIEKHENVEARNSLVDAYIANNEASINSALIEFNDPGAVIQARVDIQKNTQNFGANVGWTPERIALETRKQIGALHAGVINGFLAAGDDEGALNYFNANKSKGGKDGVRDKQKIPGDIQAPLMDKIQAQRTLGKAQKSYDDIRVKNEPDKWIEKAESINDPKVRKETKALVVRGLAEMEQAKTDDQIDAANDVYNNHILKDVPSVNDIPPDLWARLTTSTQESYRKIINSIGTVKPVVTDTNVYGALTELATGTPEQKKQFLNTNITGEFSDKLSVADVKHFENAKGAIREDTDNFTGPERINELFKEIGWDGENKKELRYAALIKIDKIAREETAKTKKPMTLERIDQISKAVLNGGFVFNQEVEFSKKELTPVPTKDTVTLTQQINNGLAASSEGLDADQRRVRGGLVTNDVNSLVIKEETRIGRKLRDEERVEIVDTVLADEVFLKGFGKDKNVLMSEVPQEEWENIYVKSAGLEVSMQDIEDALTPEISTQIIKTLKAQGKLVTVQNIADLLTITQKGIDISDARKKFDLKSRDPKIYETLINSGYTELEALKVMETLKEPE